SRFRAFGIVGPPSLKVNRHFPSIAIDAVGFSRYCQSTSSWCSLCKPAKIQDSPGSNCTLTFSWLFLDMIAALPVFSERGSKIYQEAPAPLNVTYSSTRFPVKLTR